MLTYIENERKTFEERMAEAERQDHDDRNHDDGADMRRSDMHGGSEEIHRHKLMNVEIRFV